MIEILFFFKILDENGNFISTISSSQKINYKSRVSLNDLYLAVKEELLSSIPKDYKIKIMNDEEIKEYN
ncbi:hypothetical protein ACOAK2_12260 (plasmid) [Aliarcobacter butzleri]|uniref:hypothetical protein n=1 Tax=Aliarcobacter butzleri TaxID=28197 RepID=UPI003B2865E8